MQARRLSNCLLFAVSLWLGSRGRDIFGFRRSISLHGKVPHFVAIRIRGKRLLLIEAIPRKRKTDLLDPGDTFLLFNPIYRATEYVQTASGIADTPAGAVRAKWSRSPCRHCQRTELS